MVILLRHHLTNVNASTASQKQQQVVSNAHFHLETMGDFTFWLSLWLRPKLSPKIGLSPKISQKWSHFLVWAQPWLSPNFGLSHGLSPGSAQSSDWAAA